MAQWFLLNTTTAVPSGTVPAGNPQKLLGGQLLDDTKTSLAPWQAGGGIFWPSSDPVVAAAALVAQKISASKGGNEDACDKVMLAGALNSLLTGSPPSQAGAVKTQTLSLTLAQIKALTSGTAFNVGPALPTNAQLFGAYVTWTEITGGGLSAVHLIIGDATTNNSILTSTDVFGALGPANQAAFQNRSSSQIQATLTAVGAALSAATAGALSITLYYSIG